jgi:hypothetical protein
MFGNLHLDQQGALIAPLALSAFLAKWVDSPQEQPIVLWPAHS